jgi:hypothetical protein
MKRKNEEPTGRGAWAYMTGVSSKLYRAVSAT